MAVTTSSASAGMDNERDAALKRETIRNRMNQRAFRSRRQEYVRELEEQVRHFQREGVKATQEVQVAARNVAMENALLRKFVRAYAKCSDHDIDMLLANMRDGNADVPCGLCTERDANIRVKSQQLSTADIASGTASLHTNPERVSADSCRKSLTTITPSLETSYDAQRLSELVPTGSAGSSDKIVPQRSILAQAEDHRLPPTTPTSANTDRKPLPSIAGPQQEASHCKRPEDSISCEEAATIIAGLRMRNAEEAREELGCAPQGPCHIKNIALLQLMNETF